MLRRSDGGGGRGRGFKFKKSRFGFGIWWILRRGYFFKNKEICSHIVSRKVWNWREPKFRFEK